MIYRVILSDNAYTDLENISLYIASESSSIQTAIKYKNYLLNKIQSLNIFPKRYRVFRVSRNKKLEYRSFPIDNYLIIYYLKGNKVYIDRIFHNKRNKLFI